MADNRVSSAKDHFDLSNWLIGLIFLTAGVLLPLVRVANINKLFKRRRVDCAA